MSLASDFLEAFKQRYSKATEDYKDQWENIWKDSYAWSRVMLYDERSVIHDVAPCLGLKCAHGEPFRLDAVFHEPSSHWFPMRVAIEHENSPHTFHTEIRTLLTVRCPLKVGITYTLTSDIRAGGDLRNLRKQIANDIRLAYANITHVVTEDPETEYLFLVGSEERDFHLRWLSLDFRAGTGPVPQAEFN